MELLSSAVGGALDLWLNLNHQARERVGKRVKLRRGLPAPEQIPGELEFYRMLLGATQAWKQPEWLIDVGCRNWSYVTALRQRFPNTRLLGVEVDGGRRYLTLHRRMDAALANASAEGASVVFQDFRKLRLAVGARERVAFTFFFPFVSSRPCRAWGLPARYASFRQSLAHAIQASGEGRQAQILSCHQGEWEAEIARSDYRFLGLKPERTILAPQQFSGLWPSRHPVHLFASSPLR
jgi:hypothetical protein